MYVQCKIKQDTISECLELWRFWFWDSSHQPTPGCITQGNKGTI